MDTSDSGIVFDQNGRCDYCNNFYSNVLPHWRTDAQARQEITATMEAIKKERRGEDFDCLIGLSGGVDSSYVTYLAKEQFGLRPLLYHVDAGWNSQQAVNNIEKLVDGLGLDLYTEVVDWPEMRDLQLAFFKAQVPHLDTPQDHAFFAGLYNFAARNRVKYILTGANYSTESVREPLEWHYHASDLRQLKDIHRRFGDRPLQKFPLAGIFKYRIFYRYVKGIRVVKPLDYVPYVKETAMGMLVDRFGWQRYAHKHYESRFTRFYEGFWLPTKFGYDKRRAHFSSLILSGQMQREEALEQLSRPAYDSETIAQDFEFVATKLGVTIQDLTDLLNGPKKSYRDYKNDMPLIEAGTRVLRLLGVQRALIRTPAAISPAVKVLAIGPLPGPVTGMSLAFEAFTESLKSSYDVEIIDLSKIAPDTFWGRLIRTFQAIGFTWQAWRKSRHADAIYFKISQTFVGNLKDLCIYIACFDKLPRMTVHLNGGASMRKLVDRSRPIMRALNRFFLCKVNRIVVLGPSLTDIFEGVVPREKIVDISNFAANDLFVSEDAIKRKFLNVRPLRLLFLSNLLPGKGHEELLEGFKSLPAHLRDVVQLDFAGAFESERQGAAFQAAIADFPTVKYHGVVRGTRRQALLRDAHIFCLPTYYIHEGQPLSILEAYASGCVVMTTDHSGIRDVFIAGGNGFKVEKRSAESVRHAIEAALANTVSLVDIALANRVDAESYRLDLFNDRLTKVGPEYWSDDECDRHRQYGLGNIAAFANVYKRMNVTTRIATTAPDLEGATHVILPGVGTFDHAMELLDASGMREPLSALVQEGNVPVLGVCVGMQILAASSEEGTAAGLGWIPGRVRKFSGPPANETLPLPHMGWNDVTPSCPALFKGLEGDARFYFLHSYFFECSDESVVAASATYGMQFTCAVRRDNIFGVQFHPEKSHRWGAAVLKNFADV